MELSEQLQLFEPPEGKAQMTEWPDVNRKMRSTMAEVGAPRAITGVNVRRVGTIHPYVGLWQQKPYNQPMAMFHTAREIMTNWAPQEGDRMYKGTDIFVSGKVAPRGHWDPRAGEPTERRMTTDFRLNARWMDPRTGERTFQRSAERILPPKETDEEMWQRKGEESQEDPEAAWERKKRVYLANDLATPEQLEVYKAKNMHETSQAEHLRSGGEMQPIPLGHARNPVGGSDKRKMVAGGQHRIGAWNIINPDQLLPVEHHETIFHAKYMPKPGGKKGEFVNRPEYT